MKREALAGRIYDALVDAPDGLTISEIATMTSMPAYSCRQAIQTLRLILADGDTLWVDCHAQGPREEWIYKLVDGKDVIDGTESTWMANRVGDAQTRIHVMAAGMAVAERTTDGRTVLGKKARLMSSTLRFMDEQLTQMDHKD